MAVGPGFGLVRPAITSPWMSSTAYGHSGLITRMLFQAYQFEFRPIVLCPISQLAHDHEPNETMLPIAARCQRNPTIQQTPTAHERVNNPSVEDPLSSWISGRFLSFLRF